MLPFPSTLIISTQEKLTSQKLNKILSELNHQRLNNPDLFWLDSDHSIKQIRQIKNFLHQKPFSHQFKIVVIIDTDLLGPPAQNALLKTLENPGPANFIILTTTNRHALLPTIVSRCHLLRLTAKKSSFTPLVGPSGQIKKDLLTAASLSADKDNVLPFLKQQLKNHHRKLLKNPNLNTKKQIQKLLTAIDMVKHNVDPRSALDYFFLA